MQLSSTTQTMRYADSHSFDYACSLCYILHTHRTRMPRKKGGLGHMKIPIVADTTKVITANSIQYNHSTHLRDM
jgi:hypothetical protein